MNPGRTQLLSFFILCLLTAGCTQKINPEKPLLLPSTYKLDSLPVSEINIPVQINLKPIYLLAEKSVDSVFTSPNYPNDWVQEGCDVRYKYSFRRSPLTMNASLNALTLGFTGYYRIIGSTRVCVNGTVISPWTPPCRCGFTETERRVNVSFSNSFTVQPDYKFKLQINRNDPQPLDKCEVCFWGQDITKQVMKGLRTELDLAKTQIEKTYGVVDLRPRVQQIWDQLNKVYNIYGLGWLKINPQKLRINSLFAKNDSLNLHLGLSARPVIRFEKPSETTSWVPDLASFSRNSGFSIFLDAVLHYDSLSHILNKQLEGKTFDIDKGPLKKTFIIKECRLFGSGSDKLILQVDFKGTNEGRFFLTGKPVFDKTTQMLSLHDLDFDIRSKNALLKAADWLFNKKITGEISKHTKFNLAEYIESAKNMVGQQLNREWVKGMRSYGSINDISLISIFPLSQHLVIRSNCTGNLSVKVESLDFSL